MKVLVAGGTGLVGSAIVDALLDLGADIEVGVLSRSRLERDNVQSVQGDVTDQTGLPEKLQGWNVVVDAVQFPGSPIENPRKGLTFERVDYGGTINLVDACRAAGVHHLVVVGGANADPDAEYHWLRYKGKEEEYIQASGVPYTVFRPSWIYGPNDVSLNRFLGFAKFLPFIPIIGNGKTRVAPLFIDDVGKYFAAAATQSPKNTVFNLGGPEVLTMDEIVRTALRAAGKKRPLLHHPAWFMKPVASVIQFAPGRPLTPDAVDFITMDGAIDSSVAVETYGIPLTRLEDGVAAYLPR